MRNRSGGRGARRHTVACAVLAGAWILSVPVVPVTAEEKPAAAGPFRFAAVTDTSLGLWEGEKPVLVYNHGVMSREGVAATYNRSCYVHPLHGLDGEVLTEDFAKDHPHHRGIFWGWTHVRIDGKPYDTWVPSASLVVRHEKFVRRDAGEAAATLAVESGWYLGGTKVVRDEAVIVVRPADAQGRLIDYDIAWTALEKPVELQGAAGKSYGGFTVRFNTRPQEPARIPEREVTITTPDGVSRKDLAETRLPWADFTAPFPGAPGPGGLALFVHPSHPDNPPTWLTRHYGALCVGWPGVKPGTLEPGKTVRCRYRIWVHRGLPTPDALTAAYEAYAGTK
jgi:hypothetical protein